MSIEIYPSVAKVKRNGVYQNLPGFVPETGDNSAQAMIANAETSTTAQYPHPKDSFFRLNNTLYQADADIPVNGTIAVGTNCHVSVLGNEVSDLIGDVDSQDADITMIYNVATENNTVYHTEISGYAISSETGELVANSSCKYTIIDLVPDTYYTITFKQTAFGANFGYGFVLADDSWAGVHMTATGDVTVNVPYGAKQFKLSWNKTNYVSQNITAVKFYPLSKTKEIDGITNTLNDILVHNSLRRFGKICTTEDYTSGQYLQNNGIINNGDGYAGFSTSKIMKAYPNETVYIPYTASALNNQVGGYFFGDKWVAPIGSATAENGYYKITLRDDIMFDGIMVNVYNQTALTEDFTCYVGGIIDLDVMEVEKTAWEGKTWVALGDSWTEGAYVSTCGRYTDYVSAMLGLECINLGAGGSGVQVFANNLTQAIANSADIITIYGSINNMTTGASACGDITDAANANGSLMAKWKYTIETVLALNPKARLVIIGCSPAFATQWSGYDAYNTDGDTFESSTEKIGLLARHYGLPFIDMYHLSGFNSSNFNGGYYDKDKVHPNDKGVKRVSNILYEQLKLLQPIINPLA